ncbi:MAG: chorismate mutase, partial [Oscillospiraceae bacterium]|nr:chorismate mutase [Oscillospiraceae bacterium]
MTNLDELRSEINDINGQMLELFLRRMSIAGQVAQHKKDASLPVFDPARERQILTEMAQRAGEDMREYSTVLFSMLMELSRAYQHRILAADTDLTVRIKDAVENTPKLFPRYSSVACQGVEGAYSQIACERIFSTPDITYFRTFDGVFGAIEDGLCSYGILPIENSTAGSVNKVYDLMMRHKFNIVRSARIKVDHNLLALKGSKTEDIREIFSHEQAINQCGGFLKSLGSRVSVHVVENTAEAAKMVSQSGRRDWAALSSRNCAGLYGLDCLEGSVQDQGNNYTRFICISKNLEIYPGADRTSVMLVTRHSPGALYKVLSRFYALGINLVKLE